MAHDRKTCCMSGRCQNFLRANLLVILTLIGVIVGFLLGFWVRTFDPSVDAIIWIGMPGEVYMRMLKMMILPLIVCSVITGTASLDPKGNGRVSMVALLYILVTNILPCFVATAMAFLIRPGTGVELTEASEEPSTHVMDTSDIFADLIRNLFPDNMVTACFQKAQTQYRTVERQESNSSGQVVNSTVTVRVKSVVMVPSTNILGLVVCCLVFGLAISAAGKEGSAFLNFFSSTNHLIMRILRCFVWVTPVGVASLICVSLLQAGHLGATIRSLGLFSLTVISSLLLYQLVVVPAYYFLLLRENAFKVLLTLGRPWIVSFATASSAIALPETLRCVEAGNGVDGRVSRFVVPLATALNRDGSTAFVTAACLFMAQLQGVHMTAATLLMIWVLTVLISMAAPSLPSASIVSILIILTALSIPSQAIGLLFATEWILDRLRSASNMMSHVYCAKTTYYLCKKYLPPLPSHDVMDDVTIAIDDAPSAPCQDVISKAIDVTDKLLTEKL